MRPLDWAVVLVYIVWIVYDGLRRSKGTDKVDGYFLGNRTLPWWAIGLSVMATQMSAVTLVGTTGQAYLTGLRFIQFYFGLPLAMIILSVTAVPFFHRAKVYTAYEYLEQRFDVRVRSLTSFLFLMGRAFSLGVTLTAPAVVMSTILGWPLPLTVLVICVPMIFYTTLGGVQAVAWTDVKQMVIIVSGMLAAMVVLILGIPHDVGLVNALHLAGATGRLKAVDFQFNPRETYTFWSGLIGGLFLMLAYFGCDQSQVQRYLTAKSEDEARDSLMMSAFVKIPLQLLVLSIGVLVFVFYLFQAPPMLFNRSYDARVAAGPHAAEYADLEREFGAAISERTDAATHVDRERFLASDARVRDIRARAVTIVKDTTGDSRYTDVNYVFPTFITTRMPIGLVGLLIAAIFAAAMSASAGELNSLATATIIDFYRRHFVKEATDTALPARLQACHHRLGPVRVRRRDVRGQPGVAHRSGESIRIVFLRLAARRVHAGDPDAPGDGCRRVLGSHCRDGRRADGRLLAVDARHRLPLAQRDWRSGRGDRRNGCQLDRSRT